VVSRFNRQHPSSQPPEDLSSPAAWAFAPFRSGTPVTTFNSGFPDDFSIFIEIHDNQNHFASLKGLQVLFQEVVEVRRWLFAAFAVLSFGLYATEQSVQPAGSIASSEQGALMGSTGVVVSAIPAPTLVLEMDLRNAAEMRPVKIAKVARKLKRAKETPPVKSMLSRTERHQMALMVAAKPQLKGKESALVRLFHDEDAGSGPEDVDLHRFFSRPRVAEIAESALDDDSEKELSDAIKLRLLIARSRAVQAHEKKFS
jgi:hypothetical protein